MLMSLLLFGASTLPPQAPPIRKWVPPAPAVQQYVKPDPYQRIWNRVLAGETILTENLPGQPKGRYRCFLLNGVPSFEAVREVAAPSPFPRKHEGHNCPNCGKSQYRIDAFLTGGEHQHRCQSCGVAWRH